MSTVSFEKLLTDIEAVIQAAQKEDVEIVRDGAVIAVVTRPGSFRPASYWESREAALSSIPPIPDWDSTMIISEDRDRA